MLTRDNIARRQFLATAAASAASLPGVFAHAAPPKPPARSTVVEATSAGWQRNGVVDPAVVKRMVGRALTALTGKASAADAWRQVVSPTERIGVKFNKVSANFSGANQALGDAIIEGLTAAGVRRRNIIVVEAIGARFPGTGQPDLAYCRVADSGRGRTRLTRFAADQVDAIVNVPDLKHHERVGATGALKNLAFGNTIVESPWRFHGPDQQAHIAALYALPQIAGKCRLCILNGLRGIFHAGPRPRGTQWQWNRNSLLVSTDPVALDVTAHDIVQSQRRAAPRGVNLCTPRRSPAYFGIAAGMGLGVADPRRIDLTQLQV